VDRRVVVAELAPPISLVQASFGFAHGGRFIVASDDAAAAAVWDGKTGAVVGAVHTQSYPTRPDFDFERDDPVALVYDEKQKSIVLRTFREGPELFRLPVSGDPPMALLILHDKYAIEGDTTTDVYDRTGKLLESLPAAAKTTSDGTPLEKAPFQTPEMQPLPAKLAGQLKGGRCQEAAGRAVCTNYEENPSFVYVADMQSDKPTLVHLPAREARAFSTVDTPAGASAPPTPELGLVLECPDGTTGVFGLTSSSPALLARESALRLRAAAKKDAPDGKLASWKDGLLTITDGKIAVWDLA